MKVENISKKYGEKTAVFGLSFEVHAGEIAGLLGPNGAGKTTIINMILGILEPTDGSIEVLGENMKTSREKAAAKINFAAVYAHLPANLTVWQNLYVTGLLYDLKDLKSRIAKALNDYDLNSFAQSKTGTLSSGESSRLNLAKATLNDPKLLLLDEPTASLDPSIALSIRERIKEYAKNNGTAVLWTSHNMREVESVCDKVIFLSKGRIVLEGNPGTLPAKHGSADLEELFIRIAREPLEN